MAAHQHLNPDQLRLFVDPEEHIASMTRSTDVALPQYRGSMSRMWEHKELESRGKPYQNRADWMQPHGAGLYESVKTEGVREPISVLLGPKGPIQHQGHHRIAAAAAVQRETGRKQHVPVEYQETYLQGGAGNTAAKRDRPLLAIHEAQGKRKNTKGDVV